MPELRTFDGGSVAIREDANDGKTLEGYAYRWGELSRSGVPETGGLREGFEKGAFAQAIAERGERPWPFLNTHYSRGGRTVGGVQFFEDDIGLGYRGRLLDTAQAKEYAAEAGISNEVSLEVMLDPSAMKRKGDAVIHGRVARLAALAGVPYAAYAGATVSIREDAMETITEVQVGETSAAVVAGPVPLSRDETTALATRAAEDVARSYLESAAQRSGTPDLFEGMRNLGDMMLAASRNEIPRDFVRLVAERALTDIVTTAGVNAALLTGNLTVREVAGIVSRGRPAITAFGGPAPLPDTGLSVTWPYFDGTLTDYVAAQSAQKAEIESAAVDIKLGTEALVTYAGGADIAYQLIRQGDPSILDIFGRIILTAWGVVTDAAFVTELETGSVTHDFAEAIGSVDFADLVSHAIATSLAVETATGRPAEFILASTTAFSRFANVIAAASTAIVVNGQMDLTGLNIGVGGLRIIHVPSITAGKAIVSNRLAARWHEAGPFLATAEDVAKLGRNVAYWSMGAGARYIPAGIIEAYDVTP